jgi:hypothetical protein
MVARDAEYRLDPTVGSGEQVSGDKPFPVGFDPAMRLEPPFG